MYHRAEHDLWHDPLDHLKAHAPQCVDVGILSLTPDEYAKVPLEIPETRAVAVLSGNLFGRSQTPIYRCP
jgi:hypothetical protein